jgi:hypothetical protein
MNITIHSKRIPVNIFSSMVIALFFLPATITNGNGYPWKEPIPSSPFYPDHIENRCLAGPGIIRNPFVGDNEYAGKAEREIIPKKI